MFGVWWLGGLGLPIRLAALDFQHKASGSRVSGIYPERVGVI